MMRYTLLSIFMISAEACFCQLDVSGNIKKLEWLNGTWNRTNISKEGRTGIEIWSNAGNEELRGQGVVLQGQDTIFIEKLSILVKDNAIYYVADVPENDRLVYFKLTTITDSGFVCENPKHDFPKKITYQVTGDILKAQISGNGKSTDYQFKRQ